MSVMPFRRWQLAPKALLIVGVLLPLLACPDPSSCGTGGWAAKQTEQYSYSRDSIEATLTHEVTKRYSKVLTDLVSVGGQPNTCVCIHSSRKHTYFVSNQHPTMFIAKQAAGTSALQYNTAALPCKA